MSYRPDRFRSRSRRETDPSHGKAVQGYSDNTLSSAIRDLEAKAASDPLRSWEAQRLVALKAERTRRRTKRRGTEVHNA
jgi:hypothetical protein